MNSLINRSLSKTLALIAVVASLLGATNVARAVPINVTVDSGGALLNTIGIANKDQYTVIIGGNGNSPTDNFNFLVTEVTRYNGVFDPNLPTPDSTPSAINTPAANVEGLSGSTYTTLEGWDYVVFHWGAGPAGGMGWYMALYLGGEAFEFPSLPVVGGKSIGGFSSARYYNQHVVVDDHGHNVPDSGSTVISLGLALLAIGLTARKTKVG